MDGARAAVGRVAADVRAGQPERVAQEVHEQQPRLHVLLVLDPIHRHRDPCHYSVSSSVENATWTEPNAPRMWDVAEGERDEGASRLAGETDTAGGGRRARARRAAGDPGPRSARTARRDRSSVTRTTRPAARTSWLATLIVSSTVPSPGCALAGDADAAGADVARDAGPVRRARLTRTGSGIGARENTRRWPSRMSSVSRRTTSSACDGAEICAAERPGACPSDSSSRYAESAALRSPPRAGCRARARPRDR